MRKILLLAAMALVTLTGSAKTFKTLRVTTEPQMSCSNCENKIKKNIRFEKGVHEITTDLEGQVVTVVYDADKTNEDNLVKAFDKIKYKATILCDDADTCGGANTGACPSAKTGCCEQAGEECHGEK